MVNVDKTTRSYFSVHVHGQRCVREVMTIFQAEMIFDGLREDKGEYTGGIPQCMLRMSRVPQTTKQGAKYARPFVSVTTKYHYDLMGHLISETNTTTNQTIDYIYLGDQPLAMIRPTEQVYYYHNDHLGTPQAMTNASGAVAWKAAYNAFGNATMITETITNNLRFPGQYYDAETGLHYNWNRYHDPNTGRYITADPIGLEGGVNLFGYVGGDPINYLDPEGLHEGTPGFPHMHYHLGTNQGLHDFINNYNQMTNAGVRGVDKYYHCMANCEASRRGPGGLLIAYIISSGREITDFPRNIITKKMSIQDSISDMMEDLAANKQGRDGCMLQSCDDICRPLIPASSRPFIPKPQ